MRVVAQYSHKSGLDQISRRYPRLLAEMQDAIRAVDASSVSISQSSRSDDHEGLSHTSADTAETFRRELYPKGWKRLVVGSEIPPSFTFGDNVSAPPLNDPSRDLDFVKEGLGAEIQFSKSALPVCSVCAKMTIFHNLGHIECGIEIVPVKALALEMSSGVSYFEQFVWDLRQRGVADIDIPVLILGIDA